MRRYVSKIEALALLIVGGDEHFLRQDSGVSDEDIENAKKLLYEKGIRYGACDWCGRICWLAPSDIPELPHLCWECVRPLNLEKIKAVKSIKP